MIRVFALVWAILLSSLAVAADDQISYKELLRRNTAAINQLALAMTRVQVVSEMKSYTSKVHSTPLTNPYRSDAFQRDSDNYEVLYYLTRGHPFMSPIRDSQATPVVLKNGVLVGWGPAALQSLKP